MRKLILGPRPARRPHGQVRVKVTLWGVLGDQGEPYLLTFIIIDATPHVTIKKTHLLRQTLFLFYSQVNDLCFSMSGRSFILLDVRSIIYTSRSLVDYLYFSISSTLSILLDVQSIIYTSRSPVNYVYCSMFSKLFILFDVW